MSLRWSVVLVVGGLACTPTRPRREPAIELPTDAYPIASTDRARPTPIPVPPTEDTAEHGESRAAIDGRAPRPGAYWYVVEFPAKPRTTSTYQFEFAFQRSPRAGKATMSVFDWRGREEPIHVRPASDNTIQIASPVPGERFLIRVLAASPISYTVVASRAWEPLPWPRCDPDDLDPTNPNCAYQYPACKHEQPDYSNPRCCLATCRRCTARVTGGEGAALTISMGAQYEIAKLTRGKLYQRGRFVSEVKIVHVDRTESVALVSDPAAVDRAALADHSEVRLRPAEACVRP